MPFVNQAHRDNPDPSIPGDRCYIWYKWMMQEWNKKRRWTTADKIYAQVCEYHKQRKLPFEPLRALDLAWQVFFTKEVMLYELEKEEENGPIE